MDIGLFFLLVCFVLLLVFVATHIDQFLNTALAPPRPPPQGCPPRREIRYCVGFWNRDWMGVNSRAAIGAAARAWTIVGPFRFREVACTAPHDLAITFEWEGHANGHGFEHSFGTALAHASFPNFSYQFIHFRADLAWWQAQDTPGQGFDMQSVALHEMGHILGLEHYDGWASIMKPYAVRRFPFLNDILRVWSYAQFCDLGPSPIVRIVEPALGTTWRRGSWCMVAWWAPQLSGSVQVDLYREGVLWVTLQVQAPVVGRLTIYVNDTWPVGPGYEVRISHPEVGQVVSTMVVVAP